MKPISKKPLKPASQRPAAKKSVGTSLAAMAKKIAAGEKAPKIAPTPQEIKVGDTVTGIEPGKTSTVVATVAAAPRTSLRAFAQAVADDFTAGRSMLDSAAALAAFLAKPAKGEPKVREITAIQQKFLDLCGRPEGATAGELAAAAGWPSISARATLQKLADREGYTLTETPRSKERGISFHLAKKAESLFA